MNNTRTLGFTLVELILYVSLMSIFLLSLVTLIGTIHNSRKRSVVISEVEQQAVFIMDHIVRTLSNATNITEPAFGNESVVLAVTTTIFPDPVVYSLSSEVLSFTIGAGSPIPLHNTKVKISQFQLYNLGLSGTYGSVRVVFTIGPTTHPYGTDGDEFNQIFQTAVTLPAVGSPTYE